jgi:hypothetical protein
MFDVRMDLPTFKTHLRDFLIQLKEFSIEDNSGLFGEEAERQMMEQENYCDNNDEPYRDCSNPVKSLMTLVVIVCCLLGRRGNTVCCRELPFFN